MALSPRPDHCLEVPMPFGGLLWIVRRRSRADVTGRTGQRSACQDGRVPIIINSGHSIELWPIPIRAIDRCDLTSIVQETVGIDGLRLEPKLVCEFMLHISA